MSEPRITLATLRDAVDEHGVTELHVECRFDDGFLNATGG